MSGRIQGDFLMMEIENSFHGKGAFKKGTGLSNVKKVAAGNIKLKEENAYGNAGSKTGWKNSDSFIYKSPCIS